MNNPFIEPPRPTYRNKFGCFRRESDEECRARIGEFLWGQRLLRMALIKKIAASSPWIQLLGKSQ